ncbi:MAG: hypothetical protein K9W44_12420 [Candidatus Lokiarchaeota archaeon]|nr:hypothetical protein [Candidatus Harpocratesius repetitus]
MAVTQKKTITHLNTGYHIDLAHFPGIGQKTMEKLLIYYGSDEKALDAIKKGFIGCAPGFTFKQALRFSQTYFELTEKLSVSDVIRTPDMLEIFHQIQALISKYMKTEYSKQKLHFYFPLPSSKIQLIKKRQKYFRNAIEFFSKYHEMLEKQNFSLLLKKLNNLQQLESYSKISSRIYLSDSKKVIQNLKQRRFGDAIITEFIDLEKNSDIDGLLSQYSRNFNVVIYLGNNLSKIPDLPNLITFVPQEISEEQIIPEHIINFFSYNKDLIQNMIKIVVALKSTKETTLLNYFLNKIDLQKLKHIKENASILNLNGDIRERIDLTLDSYKQVYRNFNSIISEVEGRINQEIQQEIGDRSIEIQGKQILNLFRSDITAESLRTYIPAEVDELINEIIQKNLDFMKKELLLPNSMDDLLTKLIPEFLEYPFHLDDSGILTIEKVITARYFTHRFNLMRKIASELRQTHQYLLELHQTLLEFEFFFSIGEFALQYQLTIPKLVENNKGFLGKSLLNLNLVQNYLNDRENPSISTEPPIPISYQIGFISETQNKKEYVSIDANLALLTGSNSGGKTMCLLTAAQSIILAQMGFPSLGSFYFFPFDELYFFKKSSGQISAGAFETTLLQFVSMAKSSALKLIFADELEAITEPTAAAKVLASIFTLILSNPQNFGIFVTHLGELILSELSEDTRERIRLDGIEAKGLDEKLNLIVDRNPRYHYLANSTPELILTRLSKSGNSDQQEFFMQVLKKFTH